jgi:hypothetical protein
MGVQMTLDNALMIPVDLTTLSLDTALELDRLARNKAADLKTIESFGECLGSSPPSAGGSQRLYCLQENPLNVDILNWALYRVEGPALVNIDDLDARLREVIARIKEVGSGHSKDANVLAGLKRFCLSLHTALLEEITPKVDRDEWMSTQQDLRVA